MEIQTFEIPGLILITPRVFGDHRGFFMETFNLETFKAKGLPHHFVQDNHSKSKRGILRGLHLQVNQHPQAKLVRCTQGEIFDVAVDMRPGSPTFQQWKGCILSEENKQIFYIPPGFAHGFSVISETAEVQYKCDHVYAPEDERGLAYNEPTLNIDWHLEDEPILSDRDRLWPNLDGFNYNETAPFNP